MDILDLIVEGAFGLEIPSSILDVRRECRWKLHRGVLVGLIVHSKFQSASAMLACLGMIAPDAPRTSRSIQRKRARLVEIKFWGDCWWSSFLGSLCASAMLGDQDIAQ